MRRNLVLLLASGLLLAACGGPAPAPNSAYSPTPVKQRACDDGGSGGVIIDGVCL